MSLLFQFRLREQGRCRHRPAGFIDRDKSVNRFIALLSFTGDLVFDKAVDEDFHRGAEGPGDLRFQGDNAGEGNGGMKGDMIDRGGDHPAPAMAMRGHRGNHIHPFKQPAAEKIIQVVSIVRQDMMSRDGKGFPGCFRFHRMTDCGTLLPGAIVASRNLKGGSAAPRASVCHSQSSRGLLDPP